MQVAAPLMIAGSLIQGVGGLKAGQYNAAVGRANARAAEIEGLAQEQEVRRAAREAMGQQIGAQAESGFQVGTGTALDSLRESAVNAEMDVLNVRRKAQAAAIQQREQARMAKREGWMSLVSGVTQAAGTIVSLGQQAKLTAAQYGTGSGGAAAAVGKPGDYATPSGPSGSNRGR